MRVRITKMILWFLAGLGFTTVIMRIVHGPGSVTVLTDILPWGLWKGGGVVALVPIGGAGFTVAMLVYIFQIRRFKPLVRGAVLLGLMCYSSVAFGLTMDIGVWWRIVYPLFHWQFDSVLFEIAWCIMLYLLVLVAEFGHTVLERFHWWRALSVLEKASVFLVIFGISLSTLHQSSLGTLFLATPFRLHPLWYTDFLPLLFFISSMALGCLTISFVAIVVYWLYGGEPPMKAISGITRLSAYLMMVYLAIKMVEIVASGEGPLLLRADFDTANFWVEVLLSSVIPIVVFSRRKHRTSKTAVFWASLSAIVGMSLNRVNVAGLETLSMTKAVYFPAWTEWAMTLGILAAAGLFFLFCVDYFGLFEGIRRERVEDWIDPARFDHSDWKSLFFGGQRLGAVQLYSVVFVLGSAVSFGLLPRDAVFGVAPERTPVRDPRWVDVLRIDGGPSEVSTFALAGARPPAPGADSVVVMMLDGNRDGRYVLFDHDGHVSRNGDKKSCVLCHHMRRPYDLFTGCYECHSDMYVEVDVFKHDYHAAKLGGNEGCSECHTDAALPNSGENAKDCLECHKAMVSKGSRVNPSGDRVKYVTVGYEDAVHKLCVTCHEEAQEGMPEPKNRNLARCTTCHQSLPDLQAEAWKRRFF